MDDLLEELLDVGSPGLPLPRILRAALYTGMAALIPAALLAGSGGHGDHKLAAAGL